MCYMPCIYILVQVFINKAPAGSLQQMGGFYMGLACFVLFDARGNVSIDGSVYVAVTLSVSILLLSMKFIPIIIHRPQQTIDALCDDLLCVTAHAACISMIVNPVLRHGCALHSACYIIEHRFKGRMPSLATTTVVHTVIILILVSSYVYGVRISDTQHYMLSAVCPYALELLAKLLTHVHRVAVIAMAAG